ncbi:DUF4352 domain-containing protein [Sphingobacterium multivorum]|uniref:DUF4352 domain-containing protein n=1 Tax=Sphingobacterium multivorum TaxID=28454 RepID=UPI0028AED19C|nr:DUF4352 domain-containing protein [Sphingobacterium multivorum]
MTKATIIILGYVVGLIVLIAIVPKSKTDSAVTASAAKSESTTPAAAQISVDQSLKTDYFDVTVTGYKLEPTVKTGNEFADLKKEDGTKYLIIDVTFKNTDKETRMIFDGEVLVKQDDGSMLKYEQPELVPEDGWGVLVDNINPGITKKTKLVYKVPETLNGSIYFHPARAGSDETILLGTL